MRAWVCACRVAPPPSSPPRPWQLLSHATNPLHVQPHLVRCFEGVHRLKFKDPATGTAIRRRSSGRQLWSRLSGNDTVADGEVESVDGRASMWKQSLVRASLGSVATPDVARPVAPAMILGAVASTMAGSTGRRSLSTVVTAAQAALRRNRGVSLLGGAPGAAPGPADLRIVAMSSDAGEEVALVRDVNPRQRSVEAWMGDLETAMRDTVQAGTLRCLLDFDPAGRTEWVEVRGRGGGCNGVPVPPAPWCTNALRSPCGLLV